MKTKTLMTMAVAGTFGLSTAAFAGHEVITPSQISEVGENIVVQNQGFHDSYDQSAVGSTSDATSAWLSSEASDSLSMEESIALADEGIYSDFYVVSYTPVVLETWDLYVIDTSDAMEVAAADDEFGTSDSMELAAADDEFGTSDSMELAAADDEFSIPTHELALSSSDDGLSYELALVPTEDLSSSNVDVAAAPHDLSSSDIASG